ncbi:Hsp70 protein-domain-containing protein [Paraphoma chrysanthemicola]|nr:Hsp70 protein-domain-containing protein [Paraphoma chrysanthemicola]
MPPVPDTIKSSTHNGSSIVMGNDSTHSHSRPVDYAIGIDLGTANTRTSVFRNGSVDMVPHDGELFMPSYVAFTPTTRLVGSAAKHQAGTNTNNTISNTLRFIGQRYRSSIVQSLIRKSSFQVREMDGTPVFAVKCQGKSLLLQPIEVLAMMLARAKKDAQEFLGTGCNVAHAVIAVPASFGAMQRSLVANAAYAAKLQSLRVTSAVVYPLMTYAMTKAPSETRTVMCVDFGSASLDVAIAAVKGGSVDVLAIKSGSLGGDNIDYSIVKYMVRKYEVSGAPSASGYHDPCVGSIEMVLKKAGIGSHQVHTVILAGGSSHMPWFHSTVSDLMDRSCIFQDLDVDEAATRGAAIHAAMIAGSIDERLVGLSISDTMPHPISIKSLSGSITTVYKQNSPTGSTTSKDCTIFMLKNGTAVLSVLEGGPYPEAQDYCLLGELYLEFDPIPTECAVICTLSLLHLEEYSFFTFSAKVKRTGKAVKTIFMPATREFSRSDLYRLVSKMEKLEAIEAREERRVSLRNTLEAFIVRILESSAQTGDQKVMERAKVLVNENLLWLNEHPQASESEYRERLSGVQREIKFCTIATDEQEVDPQRDDEAHTEGTAYCPEKENDVLAPSQTSEAISDPARNPGSTGEADAKTMTARIASKIEQDHRITMPVPQDGLPSESISSISSSRHMSRSSSPEISSAPTELVRTAVELNVAHSAPISMTTSLYKDEDFTQISTFLRNCGHPDWSRVPRIYTVLHLTGQVEAVADFLKHGMTDIWLPFTHNSLPSTISPTARAQFLQYQDRVLSKSLLFEKSPNEKHTHFAISEPLPFQVIGKLGAGAHSYVDKVVSQVSHREFARKLFRRHRGIAKDAITSFLNELEVLKRVQHRHCVELMYSYTDTKYFALLMMPVADCNLSEYYELAQSSQDQRSLLRSFIGCLAHALEYIHNSKIRHRDIKPQNILVKDENVLLTDFGIALDWENLSRSTTTADSGKTWVYAAPEVVRYEKRNSSADVWSLGCVFMEIVTVLKGETMASMRAFFYAKSRSHRYYANIASLGQWAKKLRKLGQAKNNIIFDWVRGMLDEDAEDRPTAATLYAHIMEACKTQNVPFCGSCCAEGAETSEDEDDDEDDPWEEAAGLISPECS